MKKSALVIVLFLLMQLFCGLLALLLANGERLLRGLPLDEHLLSAHPEWSGITLLGGFVILAALLRLSGCIRRRPVPPVRCWRVRGGLWALLSSLSLAFSLSLLLASLSLDDGGRMVQFDAMRGSIPCLLLLTVVGPLGEELVFREGILRLWRQGGHPAWQAVSVSALLFAVAHGNLALALPALASGLLFGLFYVRTGNILLSAAAHVLNNTVAVLLLAFPVADPVLAGLPAWASVMAGGLLLLLAAALLRAWLACTRPAPGPKPSGIAASETIQPE